MKLKTSNTLYINHVPKCGGTTIVDLFSRSFPPAAVHNRYTEGSAQTLLPSELRQKRLVATHLPEWVMRRRIRADKKIGLAREPWARFNSIVRHHMRDAKAGAPPPHVAEFTRVYAAGDIRGAFDTVAKWYHHDSLTNNYAADPLSSYLDLAEAAQSAMKRIQTYDLIIQSEHIDALHPLLCRLAGQPQSPPRRLNAARDWEPDDSVPFGPEFEVEFKRIAAPDYEVFAELRRRADQSTKELAASLEGQPPYEQIIAERARGTHEIALEAGDGIACAGWDRPVISTGGRHVGRYGLRMCDDEALVDIGVPSGRPLLLELILWIGGGLATLASIEFQVNDRQYSLSRGDLTVIEDAHDRCCATVFLRHVGATSGFCRITFRRTRETSQGHADLWLFAVRAQDTLDDDDAP